MRFTKIVLSAATFEINLNKDEASPSDPYILRGADGLGPSQASLSIAYGELKYHEEANKEPVFLIGLNPDYSSDQTASDLRDELYGLISRAARREVFIQFFNGSEMICFTKAFVRNIEIVPFDRDPRVQVALATTRSYFQAPLPLDTGQNISASVRRMTNIGTDISGFTAQVQFPSAATSFKLTDMSTNEIFQIDYAFLSGDILSFSTQEGDRYITITRNTGGQTPTVIPIPKAMSADSSWLTLKQGYNTFVFITTQANTPVYVTWLENTYLPKYLGV